MPLKLTGDDGFVPIDPPAVIQPPAAPALEPTCSNCPNWFFSLMSAEGVSNDGECRIVPPVMMTDGSGCMFPPTAPGDWCGQHPARRG